MPPRGWRRRIVPALLVTLISAATAAHATGQTREVPQIDSPDARATVVVDGRPLFVVAGILAAPASLRARTYERRIRALAADPGHVPGSLVAVEAGDHTELRAGTTVVLTVYDADAALEGVPRGPVVAAIQQRVGEAIRQYREERSAAYLRSRALAAGVLTLALAGWIWTTRRASRYLTARIERRYRTRIDSLRIATLSVVRVDQFWKSLDRSTTAVWSLLTLAAVLAYGDVVLSFLPWTRGVARTLADLILGSVGVMAGGVTSAIPDLVFLAILAIVVRWVLRTMQLAFTGLGTGELRLGGFEPDWALPTYVIARTVVVAFALVVAFPYIPGSSSEAFKSISIFFGVLVSLGSSSVVGNTLAGLMLIYRRAFRPGDRVKIGQVEGDVIQVKLQVTHLRTVRNEEVIVPNSTILGSDVVNYSSYARRGELILRTAVGIGYETPWRQVEAMLILAAGRTQGLLATPPPFVWQTGLGDFAVTYELHAYCNDANHMAAVYTEMHRQVLDVFNEYDVQIMTPAYVRDPEQPKTVPRDQWYAAPARRDVPGPPSA